MPRLVHLSDTHLGHSAYARTDPSGINQREADIYAAFDEAVGYVLETRPDLVVHSGDLFDSVRPPNRAIFVACRQLARISRAGIPVVIISGNHSTPRQRSRESIFRLFEFFENIHPVYEGEYRKIGIGYVMVHAVPHPYSEEAFERNFRSVKADRKHKYNVLMAHATVEGVAGFHGAEFKDMVIPRSVLPKSFSYIALGHLHKFTRVEDNAFYSGSPERMGFAETGYEKGFLDVDLDGPRVKHVRTNAREMVDLGPIDCSGLDAAGIARKVEEAVPPDISGKILRITFGDISPHARVSLDHKKINSITADALHCEKEYRLRRKGRKSSRPGGGIGAVADEFAAFVREHVQKEKRKEVEKLGMKYLEMAARPEGDGQ